MKTIAILILMTGFAASASPYTDAAKGAADAAKAAKGGAAAIDAGRAASKGVLSFKAARAARIQEMAPTDVGSFRANLDKLGIPSDSEAILIDGYNEGVVDMGCTEKGLTADAQSNMAKIIKPVVDDVRTRGTNINYEASLLKHADLNNDGVVDAEEKAASDDAGFFIRNEAGKLVQTYSVVMHKSLKESAKSVQHLATSCGLNVNFAANIAIH